jgi:integrase
MATIRELTKTSRGEVRWQAIVRRGGHDLSRTFPDRRKAEKWAKDVEAAISLDCIKTPFNKEDWLPKTAAKTAMAWRHISDASPHPTPSWTVGRALAQYWEEKGQWKASPQQERTRTKHLTASLGHIRLAALKPEHVQKHINDRKDAGKSAATIRLEVMQLRAMWKHARMVKGVGWGLDLGPVHPCQDIKMDPVDNERSRRLQEADQEMGIEAEEARIRRAIMSLDIPDMKEVLDVFEVGLLTGMRRGEILDLYASEVKRQGGLNIVEKEKHKTSRFKHKRRIVLPERAADILRRRKLEADENGKLFSMKADRFRHYFRKACRAADVRDFHFHDVRHEAISRMDEAGLSMSELKDQSGHRSAQMLMRYGHARARGIAAKLG